MKKIGLILILLTLGSIAGAVPFTTFTATPPTLYEDGAAIPPSDVLTYRVYCSDTLGGPYNFFYPAPSIAVGEVIDISTCVQGVPGTYYFVSTATSTTFGSESVNSNEVTRVYSAADLGKIPQAPTLFTVQ